MGKRRARPPTVPARGEKRARHPAFSGLRKTEGNAVDLLAKKEGGGARQFQLLRWRWGNKRFFPLNQKRKRCPPRYNRGKKKKGGPFSLGRNTGGWKENTGRDSGRSAQEGKEERERATRCRPRTMKRKERSRSRVPFATDRGREGKEEKQKQREEGKYRWKKKERRNVARPDETRIGGEGHRAERAKHDENAVQKRNIAACVLVRKKRGKEGKRPTSLCLEGKKGEEGNGHTVFGG